MYFIYKIDPAVKDDADNADSNNEYEADDDADEDNDGENGNYEEHLFDDEVQMFSSSSNSSSLTSDNDNDDSSGDDDDNNNEKKIIGSAKEGNLVSSSINNKTFEQPNPTRSVRITGFDFAGKDDNLINGGEFDSIEYISEDAIARAILKPCCKEECLRKKLNSSPRSSCLNFESVYNKVLEARKQLVGNTIKDKTLILKTIIQGNTIKIYNISFRCLFIKQHARTKNSFALFRRSFFVEF